MSDPLVEARFTVEHDPNHRLDNPGEDLFFIKLSDQIVHDVVLPRVQHGVDLAEAAERAMEEFRAVLARTLVRVCPHCRRAIGNPS